jgi:flagellar basal-body rod protein FlgB
VNPEAQIMAMTDLPILSMLRTRMQWHQERQRVLAENVANSDTPKFRPRDLKELDFKSSASPANVGIARTNAAHFAASADSASRFQLQRMGPNEIRPAGNAVNLEDEMMKVAQNQMDYQAATMLYSRSLGLIKTALGKK